MTIQDLIKAKEATYKYFKYFTEKESLEAINKDCYNIQFIKNPSELLCLTAVK